VLLACNFVYRSKIRALQPHASANEIVRWSYGVDRNLPPARWLTAT
jgi:hypothetical protein